MVYSIEYSASRGVHLYNVSYPNQQGFRNLYFGFPCTGDGHCNVSPNPYYSENIGYRGNQGFSSYYGINNRFTVNNLFHSGVLLTANYTCFTRSITPAQLFSRPAARVLRTVTATRTSRSTTGISTRPDGWYQPNLYCGPAEFDIRHRVVVYGNWKVPVWSPFRRLKTLFTGWSVDPLFLARSGQPFSVFDTTAQTLDLSAPARDIYRTLPHQPKHLCRRGNTRYVQHHHLSAGGGCARTESPDSRLSVAVQHDGARRFSRTGLLEFRPGAE